MDTRRSFLKKSSLTVAALALPGMEPLLAREYKPMKEGKPKKGLVVWYSQTGNTERDGKVIAGTWKKLGLEVDAVDYRTFDKSTLPNYDIIAFGSPVYYYEVPANFQYWLKSIPNIDGIPVTSYVTFGGKGGNQHNTACTLLELAADKGGVPIGMSMFGNMPTFSITWSYGSVERVLKFKHLPSEKTYERVREYASQMLTQVNERKTHEIDTDLDFRGLIKGNKSIIGTKFFIGKHTIDKEKCIGCGTCVKMCPVKAIDLPKYSVNTGRCIACLGCVNNCPAQAVDMEFMGKKVYGYYEFLKRNNIVVKEPEEAREAR
ncbi:MAG: 4Fe-4S dicluster domain-containing protein [bacterium]|nr:4Fe-4S dicluster domain-containing protein [bacterium]